MLWSHLRDRQLFDSKFRRQHPIGDFIVDFCCIEKRLIVEVDGDQHALKQNRYDEERAAALKLRGFNTIRFWNAEVMSNIEGVLEAIGIALRQETTT